MKLFKKYSNFFVSVVVDNESCENATVIQVFDNGHLLYLIEV